MSAKNASNASKQLGLGVVGALLAGGLLLAACAVPEGQVRAKHPGDAVFRPPGSVADRTQVQHAKQGVPASVGSRETRPAGRS
ncbi:MULTISPECIES: hypothetical protein [unclassified Streptomyces]|uniref:hypothetical protein n=1 Tax=unclassified Streptomyces TaxID=2593676 RepID=UPI001BEA5409|nr:MULTISPECIES: hypothetical protein [unclassified Streptomyces]MBT2408406.1 hypothetical protein [Streptomyces sp. ISL-21]MBT2454649.1 hypothetical protein [Streptomyces sp. ISL-86]MBT2611733.1 hypothetical protein [Streptomyces sp. ISL-87]